MSSIDIKATWHKESYDRFLNELLPQLLAERLPLAGYHVDNTDTYTCRVTVAVVTESGQNAEVTYTDVPQPDEYGIFVIDDTQWTVVPRASSEDLDSAEILCVGEMLHAMLQERLGEAPPDLPWDETLLRAWLPLDTWIGDRFQRHPEYLFESHFQYIDSTNWLSKRTHLRRLFIDLSDPNRVTAPGQFGRICPYEKPEGPNMGRIGTIAVGATIRDKKLISEDECPEAALGLSTSAIPLLEHTDANRLLMGANMMRQWLPYDQPEPALVQSGKEPSVPEFWCGRNMLTAFLSWSADIAEDGIILSESGARHLNNSDHQIEPGDKLSNRYGIKGVVSRILPDAEMPKLNNGTPVELIFNSIALHSRLTIGQLREAVLGRLARAEGEPIISPPFDGLSEDTIVQRLTKAGLPQDGMEHLLHGDTGQPLPQPSLAGWVYWGRTDHLVRDKLHASVDYSGGLQRQSELEFQMLRKIGAVHTIREHFHTRAGALSQSNDMQIDGLATQVAMGTVSAPDTPTERFHALQSRLAAAGIGMMAEEGILKFNLQAPNSRNTSTEVVQLARPVAHPWLGEHQLEAIGQPAPSSSERLGMIRPDRVSPMGADSGPLPEFQDVAQANEKLARLQAGNAPDSLLQQAYTQLENAIHRYFDVLLTPEALHFNSRVLFSGRTVLAPGTGFTYEQVGLAEEMAWTLFSPQVIHKVGSEEQVAQRTPGATEALDEIMAQSWVIVNRVPTFHPTAILAFRPVRIPDKVVRLPIMACIPLNADFDGDQCAVFLPLTDAGQREAGEKLSLAGHLTRDREVLHDLVPYRDPMWGLALHSLEEAGRRQIEEIVGGSVSFVPGYVTRDALIDALTSQLKRHDATYVLERIDQLTTLGFDVIKETGFSLGPFAKLGLDVPEPPPVDRTDLWVTYMQQRSEQMLSTEQYDGDWGHYILASKCGALSEGRMRTLPLMMVARGVVNHVDGHEVVVAENFRDGLSAQGHFATVAGAQAGLRRVGMNWEQSGSQILAENRSASVHVLARARRAANPGVVFARAAAMGEVDPLVDEVSRLFVGIQSE